MSGPMRIRLVLALLLALTAGAAPAVERFPRPQFETGHALPPTPAPAPRAEWLDCADTAVLALTLLLAGRFALRARSRRGLLLLLLFGLLYFGFWRQGCICPIGSIQNVALAAVDPSYAIPWVAVAFFVLPLAFALFHGRTFCAAVCPLGAIQDVVLMRPVALPAWLAQALGLLRYVVLGLAVLLAVSGAGFLVCRFDPFVGFFRRGAPPSMLIFGGALLLLGTVIGRPYCRFLCPYGVLLGWMSRFTRRHLAITPDECIRCRLCETACPFDAIRFPAPPRAAEPRRRELRRLAGLLAALPAFVAAGAVLVSGLHAPLASLHPDVQLAAEVRAVEDGAAPTAASRAFAATGTPVATLDAQAAAAHARLRRGGTVAGGFVGLCFGLQLVALAVRRARRDYEPDRVTCVSCGRCFLACPMEHRRRRGMPSAGPHWQHDGVG